MIDFQKVQLSLQDMDNFIGSKLAGNDPKDLPRNNLCNLLVIGILICDLDTENRDLHSDTCITYSGASPKLLRTY
jgi:hypothetical protein